MQSNLKFDRYITLQKDKASKILGAIKNALHEAPREGKLLAYTSLCHLILEHADTIWNPTLAKDIESLGNVTAQGSEVYCWIKEMRKFYQGMLSAWPLASQTETQDSPTQSPHENTAGRTTFNISDGIR